MAVLAGGTAIAQALSFAASPILSRLFTESDYGEFGVFTSAMAYCIAIACFRLDNAIVLPKNNNDAKSIVQWIVKISSRLSLLILFGSTIGLIFFKLPWYFVLLGPAVFLTTLIQSFNFYSSRQKSYNINSTGRIIHSLGIAGTSIIYGLLQLDALGLVLATFTGTSVASGYLYYHFRKEIFSAENTLSWNDIKSKYKDFLFINTPHALLDLTESAGQILLMGLFFNKAEIGAYFFAYRILKTPVGLIGNAIFQVLYREFSEHYNLGTDLTPKLRKVMSKLLLISLPIFSVLFLFGQKIFSFIFGEDWINSGLYASILAPWFCLNFISSTISFLPLILNKLKQAFIINIINTLLKVGLTLICGYFFNFLTLMYVFAISHSVIMIFMMFWYYRITTSVNYSTAET